MLLGGEKSATSQSQEYQSFRSTIPQQKVVVDSADDDDKVWTVYDAGPKSVRCPLIFLPPASGTADIFFKQILALSSLGYRVMSIEYPVYWTTQDWVEGFRKLLDHFRLDKVHIFGASLGGFLAQKFGEHTFKNPRIHSLILCNAFTDTTVFQQTVTVNFYWMLPGFALKKMIMDHYNADEVDPDIADSIDFMVERLDSLGRAEIASRLTLNCTNNYVEPQKLRCVNITMLDVFDACAISDPVKEDLYKCYPNQKRAHLKTGGNFPYLCRSAEVNLHIQIHLRQFNHTRFSAIDPKFLPDEETEEVASEVSLPATSASSMATDTLESLLSDPTLNHTPFMDGVPAMIVNGDVDRMNDGSFSSFNASTLSVSSQIYVADDGGSDAAVAWATEVDARGGVEGQESHNVIEVNNAHSNLLDEVLVAEKEA